MCCNSPVGPMPLDKKRDPLLYVKMDKTQAENGPQKQMVMKRQASADSAVELGLQTHKDEVDGVPNRAAMTIEERRKHFRRMQSMGSLCNAPVMFSLTNQVTSVARALKVMKDNDASATLTSSLSLNRSRSSSTRCSHCEEAEKIDSEASSELLNKLILRLQKQMDYMQASLELESSVCEGTSTFEESNWFPRKISDLDYCTNRVLTYGVALDADHPGFKDNQYRERRKYFANIAYKYKYGDTIPRVDYSEEETKTWGRVFSELLELYPKYACKEYLQNLQHLRNEGLYCKDRIPQLEDVSNFLKERTGFQIRPVAGYLSSRDFLSGLAFRTFACTQYIRHSSDPFYTPEPDCCHELMGHVPMFADKSFAQFSQEIGLASLGASDEDIEKLSACYFFTIEFGLCKQNDQTKVYGAGLMSSISELRHAMTGNATILPFTPEVAIQQECRITTFQDAYFITPSFAEAKNQMREYAGKIQRPFTVRYDPYTLSVEVLSSVEEMVSMIGGLKDDLGFLTQALVKIQSLQ